MKIFPGDVKNARKEKQREKDTTKQLVDKGGKQMKKLAAAALAAMMCMASTAVSAAGVRAEQKGNAVFDFGDSAFFSVRMYEGESIYLELDTDYQQELAEQLSEQTGQEADRFYRFNTGEQSFARTGELFLAAQEDQTVYQIEEDGTITQPEAEYAQGLFVGKDGQRISGYVIRTKTLGNYVVAESVD